MVRSYGRTRKLSKVNLQTALDRLYQETMELHAAMENGRHPIAIKNCLHQSATELLWARTLCRKWEGVKKEAAHVRVREGHQV